MSLIFNGQEYVLLSSVQLVPVMPSDTRTNMVSSHIQMNSHEFVMNPTQNIMLPSNFKFPSNFSSILRSESTVEKLTLIFVLHNFAHNFVYYVEYVGRHVLFKIPSVDDALKIGKGTKIPPTCFILFRKIIQGCVTSLGLRIQRKNLSKHVKNIWNDQKTKNPKLEEDFKLIAHMASKKFYSSRLRVKIHCQPKKIDVSEQSINNANLNNSEDPALYGLIDDLFPAIKN
ncbi:20413_t:CDS:1 [Cetraspora pellucida]|uniref:20413_t:CDS:1 n=1 Tax=Cetraspora pellucida TaxID=1433469 RepID=A0A9N9HL71_9GLOM|nr:20413_t:CDS:1 [Cetraspora pellucida]